MAQHKAAGNCRQGGQPRGKADGIKIQDGQKVLPGNIIIRQRGKGSVFRAGLNCSMGRDHTIFSTILGKAFFYHKNNRKYIGVIPMSLSKPTTSEMITVKQKYINHII